MNQLSEEKRKLVLDLLSKGHSDRNVARIVGVHKNTVGSLRRRQEQSLEPQSNQTTTPEGA